MYELMYHSFEGVHGPQKKKLYLNSMLNVRWVCFWEGGLRFLVYTVVIFTFGCTVYHLYTTLCIYLLKNLNRILFFKKKFIFILLRVSFHLQNRTEPPDS